MQPSTALLSASRTTPPVPALVAGETGAALSAPLERATPTAAIRAASILAADMCAAALALGTAYLTAGRVTDDAAGLTALLPWIGCALAGVLFHLATHGHYARRMSFWTELQAVAAASGGALLATALAAYMSQDERARLPVLAGWALFPLLVMAARTLARAGLDAAGLWRIPVVVVGDEASAAGAAQALRSAPHLGYTIAGQVAPAHLADRLTTQGWRGVLRQYDARMIVLAFNEGQRPPPRIIEALVRDRIPVAVMRETDGLPSLSCDQSAFPGHETMMLCYATARAKPVSRLVKSALDISVAALALAVLLPLFAIIAILIKCDGGPVLFSHRRIGSGGQSFKCLKFRTMVQDSDAVLAKVLAEDSQAAREWAGTQKLRHDPRVTWVGRVLRKTSLDELPQLINVLRLEMSLVGPRPIVSREISRYADDISYYYEIRPGITGLWQISGRNDTTYARRVELDRWYVKNWTIGQDIAILARTIPAVLSGRGAS